MLYTVLIYRGTVDAMNRSGQHSHDEGVVHTMKGVTVQFLVPFQMVKAAFRSQLARPMMP